MIHLLYQQCLKHLDVMPARLDGQACCLSFFLGQFFLRGDIRHRHHMRKRHRLFHVIAHKDKGEIFLLGQQLCCLEEVDAPLPGVAHLRDGDNHLVGFGDVQLGPQVLDITGIEGGSEINRLIQFADVKTTE